MESWSSAPRRGARICLTGYVGVTVWVCIFDLTFDLSCAQMMQNLLLQEGDLVRVKNATLPKAKFVKLRPQSIAFLDIQNPRAV